MGRKRGIATQLSGKSLAQARQYLRDIEKQMIDEATQKVGRMVLDLFRDDPEATLFAQHPQLKKALTELQQVSHKKPRKRQVRSAGASDFRVNPNTARSATEAVHCDHPQPDAAHGDFVADVPDHGL